MNLRPDARDVLDRSREFVVSHDGTYYGALLQVMQEGQPGGTIVFVWRRVNGEWRLVAYRAID